MNSLKYKLIFITIFTLLLSIYSCKNDKLSIENYNKSSNLKNQLKHGDIIFYTSKSSQSEAIQLATNSKYSHCGIIFYENGYYVYEASNVVKLTPLSQWIKSGKDGKYVVKRLKKHHIIQDKINKFNSTSNYFLNKKYDLTFEWSSDKIFCSELI